MIIHTLPLGDYQTNCYIVYAPESKSCAVIDPGYFPERILAFLKRHMGERITLADVGTLTYFSPVYCDTVFKKDTGRSIVDYLLEMRVTEAKSLLLEGELTLKEIAERTGFGDSNYFSRIFKRYF